MICQTCFTLLKVKEGLAGDYIKCQINDDVISKEFSVTYYLVEIRQHLENIIKKLKNIRSSWKTNFALGFFIIILKNMIT